MGASGFTRPKGLDGESTPNLYVANCGPAVCSSFDEIALVFGKFGEVRGVFPADESGARVIVSYFEVGSAQAALKALNGHPCSDLGGRVLHIRYSILRPPPQAKDSVSVCLLDSELGIPGIHLFHDFITTKEEEELLAAVDSRPWKSLSKRRVQHYGYEFLYEAIILLLTASLGVDSVFSNHEIVLVVVLDFKTRNVNTKQQLGELPPFVSPILQKISLCTHIENAENITLNQLTVNEYPPGVGLSPHIDTHSTFEGLIFSLSLAGPCIMEFRRYSQGTWLPSSLSSTEMQGQNPDSHSTFVRRSVFLPPRSLLLLSGEARYAWHHYIPHHKVDMVGDNMVRRGSRRVSFTFRKVRAGPCQCEFPQYCDSQK